MSPRNGGKGNEIALQGCISYFDVNKTENHKMKRRICRALLLAALGTLVAPYAAADDESEPNDSVTAPQPVNIPNKSITINGALSGVKTTDPVFGDVDFYKFYGQAGDVVTVDIDQGMKLPGVAGGSVNTVLGIFKDQPDFPMLRYSDNATPMDEGSVSNLDPRIDEFKLPSTGYYLVGVSNSPRHLQAGGKLLNPTKIAGGSYTLVISGVSSPMLKINIDVKPGNDEPAPFNQKSKGKIPVALISSMEFNAVTVDMASITFGATGDEHSLSHCGTGGTDVNGDGRLDLVCHFENQKTGLQYVDPETGVKLEGILRGKASDGRLFEGRGFLKIVPPNH